MKALSLGTLTTVVALSVAPATSTAQTSDEINGGIQFDFSLPGARSLGMGGAFVALADDATAGYSNPAGLTTLSRPEVSIEGRLWNFYSILPHSGHAFGAPTGRGIDTVPGVSNLEIKDTATRPSFISFVLARPRWALAVYRHDLSAYRATIESEGPFASDTRGTARVNPLRGDLSLDIADIGASVAVKVTDSLSLGLGAGRFSFEFDSLTRRYFLTPHLAPGQRIDLARLGQNAPGGQLGEADFSDPNVFFFNTGRGEDSAVAITAGLLWKPTGKWSFGAAYRQGPNFDFNTQFVLGQAHNRAFGSPANFVVDEDEAIFHVPDSYAVGAAFRPSDRWTISFEYNFVQYEQLLNGSGDGRPVEIAGLTESTDPDPALRAELRRQGENIVNGLAINNANQARLGVEWIARTGRTALILRTGAWYDPDHRVRFEGQQEIPGSALDLRLGDEIHFGGGIGVAGSRFQVDAGIDVSNRVNTVSTSAVLRF